MEDRYEGIVVVEPIRNEDGKKRVLPGAKKTIGPVLDGRGNIKHGFTKEQLKYYENKFATTLDDKYWANYTVVLTDSRREFDLSNDYDRMDITFVRQHPWICDIGGEVTKNTIYTVIDEEFVAEQKAKALDYKKTAYKYLEAMDLEDVKGFLRLYGLKIGKESKNVLMSKLEDILITNPKKFVQHYEDKNKDTKILLKKLVSNEIVHKNKEHYFWGEVHMGENVEIAVAYLNNVEHQEAKIAMLAELKEKENMK
jgi:hypothetical protein